MILSSGRSKQARVNSARLCRRQRFIERHNDKNSTPIGVEWLNKNHFYK
jgi:hypothetical protein